MTFTFPDDIIFKRGITKISLWLLKHQERLARFLCGSRSGADFLPGKSANEFSDVQFLSEEDP